MLYGQSYDPDPRRIPCASFTPDQIRQLLRADKIRPLVGPPRAFVNAFTIAQHAKQRLRVIAEPSINPTCGKEAIYSLPFPAGASRAR
jgi:hypothetical protein